MIEFLDKACALLPQALRVYGGLHNSWRQGPYVSLPNHTMRNLVPANLAAPKRATEVWGTQYNYAFPEGAHIRRAGAPYINCVLFYALPQQLS